MYTLNKDSQDRLQYAYNKGIISRDTTNQDIVDIVTDQEIVSYCTENGCVSFDVYDLDYAFND